jgi:hypothetical protein
MAVRSKGSLGAAIRSKLMRYKITIYESRYILFKNKDYATSYNADIDLDNTS